jgi:hypothetical protein
LYQDLEEAARRQIKITLAGTVEHAGILLLKTLLTGSIKLPVSNKKPATNCRASLYTVDSSNKRQATSVKQQAGGLRQIVARHYILLTQATSFKQQAASNKLRRFAHCGA